MILGAGWAFLGLVAVGLAALFLVPGCGLVVVSTAPTGDVRLEAPALVEADPVVEAGGAALPTVSLGRARSEARRAVLRIRNTCDGDRSGTGFALGDGLLLTDPEAVPGASRFTISSRATRARTVAASRVYRLGAFALANVDTGLPKARVTSKPPASGTSVAVVGYPHEDAQRPLPGVVVDSVAGAPFGVPGPVLRLTSMLRHDEPGGPVVDPKGRIVAVAFAADPRTGLAVAAPIATLRSLVDKRALEILPACAGN